MRFLVLCDKEFDANERDVKENGSCFATLSNMMHCTAINADASAAASAAVACDNDISVAAHFTHAQTCANVCESYFYSVQFYLFSVVVVVGRKKYLSSRSLQTNEQEEENCRFVSPGNNK